MSISEIPKEPAERGPSCISSSSTPPTGRTKPPFLSDGDSLAFSTMAHEDHVLRKSVEIEDEVGLGLGLGVVMPSVWDGASAVGGGRKVVEDCQFVGMREGSEETRVMGSEDRQEVGDVEQRENEEPLLWVSRVLEEARSEISSIPGSVSEDVVIGTAEVVDIRSRRVPETSREKVKEWIVEMERILNSDGDGDRELVCFHGYTARERRRARGDRERFGNDREVEVDAEDRDGSVVDTGENGGSRGDGTGEVPVVPKEREVEAGAGDRDRDRDTGDAGWDGGSRVDDSRAVPVVPKEGNKEWDMPRR
jgi:hypothetical protein